MLYDFSSDVFSDAVSATPLSGFIRRQFDFIIVLVKNRY